MNGYIEIRNLEKENIVIEKREDFETSIFRSVYDKADRMLEKMKTRNQRIIDDKQENSADKLIFDNVISFEGRRGTGKTSAMMSFRNSLKNKNSDKENYVLIDYIDASTLEAGEKLLELILANMFTTLREIDRYQYESDRESAKSRELYRQFDSIYGSLLKLDEGDRHYRQESPLRALTQLSNSQTLQKGIEKLVKEYLEYVGDIEKKNGHFYKESYLVIAIDDLDMHFQGKEGTPFVMLETLHRYLMIPRVIILLTYNFDDLCLGCEKYFTQVYSEKYTRLGAAEIEDQIKETQRLTREYLEKVLPIHTRIHMMSWRKRDYGEGNAICIRMDKDKIAEYIPSFGKYLIKAEQHTNQEDGQAVYLETKKFLFLLKAASTGVYYDACGEKRHYSDVTDFRELAQNVAFYRQLGEMDNESVKNKELLDELYFRFVPDHLSREERKQFDRYLAVHRHRRSKDILSDIQALYDKNKNEPKGLSEITYYGKAQHSYSYGELLYGLYVASHRGWFSKALVWCILDSYTLVLTGLYRGMKGGDQDKREALARMIGTSVASSWSNLFLPSIARSKKESEEESGVPKRDYTQEFRRSDEKKRIGAVKFVDVKGSFWKFKLHMWADRDELIEQLHMLEILHMFFGDVYHDSLDSDEKVEGFKVRFDAGALGVNQSGIPERDSDTCFEMRYSDACFNVMNFIRNLFMGEDYFISLHDRLRSAYQEYFKALKRVDNEVQWIQDVNVDKFLKENSLYELYKGWYTESDGLAMPVYSFDMMYNIFKRQYQYGYRKELVTSPAELWIHIKRMYYDIGLLLKEQDMFYHTDSPGKAAELDEQNAEFFRKYMGCPFIDYVHAHDEQESHSGTGSEFDYYVIALLDRICTFV